MRGPQIKDINTDLPTLHEQAACRDSDPDLFFPDDALPQRTYEMLVAAAKDICAGCPVLDLCRDHGLRYEEYGIWGGLTPAERRKLRRENDKSD